MLYNDIGCTEYALVEPCAVYKIFGHRITAYGRVGFPLFNVEDIRSIYSNRSDFEFALMVVGNDNIGCFRYRPNRNIKQGRFITLEGLRAILISLDEVLE